MHVSQHATLNPYRLHDRHRDRRSRRHRLRCWGHRQRRRSRERRDGCRWLGPASPQRASPQTQTTRPRRATRVSQRVLSDFSTWTLLARFRAPWLRYSWSSRHRASARTCPRTSESLRAPPDSLALTPDTDSSSQTDPAGETSSWLLPTDSRPSVTCPYC